MERFNILFTGDIYPGDIAISEELSQRMSQADYRVGNLEGVMGDFGYSDAVSSKTLLPSASSTAVRFLEKVGLDYVSLANNHMFDYGTGGWNKNMELLESKGIAYSGAGNNLEQAKKPHIFAKNGIKVAIVSCAWNGTEALYATETSAGCAPLDEEWLKDIPQSLKSSGIDHVILYVHWGYCDYSCPLPEHKTLAERLINKGYSAIVGHHNHQMQGVLAGFNYVIAFGLGDFAFAPYKTASGKLITQTKINSESAIIELILGKDGSLNHNIIFTVQNGNVVEMDERALRKKSLKKLCEMLSFEPYEKLWKKRVFYRLLTRMCYWLNPLNWRNIKPRTVNALFIMIRNIFNKNS